MIDFTDLFLHPLSESSINPVTNQTILNNWAVASLCCMEAASGSEEALDVITKLALLGNPIVNTAFMLDKAKAGDKAMAYQLVSLVKQGLDIRATQSL